MRYLLLLLIFGACARHRDKQDSIKHRQDSIRCFGGMAPYGSSILVSDSAYIHRLDKYLNDSTFTFRSDDSIVYIFNDSSLYINGAEVMYGENVPLGRIIHDHRDAKACTACKLRNAYINVWKNY